MISEMANKNIKLGISLSFLCLFILGFMPVISNSRPQGFDALNFAFFLSAWQLLFSLPLLYGELRSNNKGIFQAALPADQMRKIITVILLTGIIFGLSTYAFVLAIEKAGTVSAAIAIQAYPLFAILWESIFLNRKKSATELTFTMLVIISLYFLATGGTWQIEGFSFWFLFALSVPFLWSVAHVIIKEVLGQTPITPAQITFFRVLISSLLLLVVLMFFGDSNSAFQALGSLEFQKIAMLMGLVYYVELIIWFYAVKHIDVSLASSITIPAPAVTMFLALLFLNEAIESYQLIAMAFIFFGMYGLLYAGKMKRQKRPES